MIDVTQDPAVLIFSQVLKQSSVRLVIHVETLASRISWHKHFLDDLLGQAGLAHLKRWQSVSPQLAVYISISCRALQLINLGTSHLIQILEFFLLSYSFT